MDFDAHKIRETDSQGRLTGAGFWWHQARPKLLARNQFSYWWSIQAAIWLGLLGVAGIIFPAFGRMIGGWPLLIAGLAGFNAYRIRKLPADRFLHRRAIVFRTDGTTLSTPEGEDELREMTVQWEDVAPGEKFPVRHNKIASIEVNPGGRSSYGVANSAIHFRRRFAVTNTQVVFHFEDGLSVPVFGHLPTPEEARIVATNLTEALREVRAAMSKSTRRG